MVRFSRSQRVRLLLTIATLGLLIGRRNQKKRCRRRKQRPWVRRHLLNPDKYGASAVTIPTLIRNDPDRFITLVLHVFEWVLQLVTPVINKMKTCMRKPISARTRLYATLAFLSTGDSYRSLELLFLIGESTIGRFVPEVCDAIFAVLKDKYMKCPSAQEAWTAVADTFRRKWQLPNCIGALDGKHIRIKKPDNTGSNYFNYKSFFSVVLMALVDAQYRFLYVNVGSNGRVSDGGVFRGTSLQRALQRGSNMFPPPRACPGDNCPSAFYIVVDDAFGLAENIMKPFSYRELGYEKRIFNYRISRGT